MASYLQMGHNSENLVGEEGLELYKNIILSPINRTETELKADISKFLIGGVNEVILDPQLYYPQSQRGKIQEHSYFPRDFDTADRSSEAWWREQTSRLAAYVQGLGASTVASPAFMPKTWDPDFYSLCAQLQKVLKAALESTEIQTLTTVVADTSDLTKKGKANLIASIMSRTVSSGYYVVFCSDLEPRREYSQVDELLGMMNLVYELKQSGRQVIVSHCNSEMILMKASGADHCATGKFFNLRRFTKSRFDDPSGGGGQLPYWFEHSLLAHIRQADIARLVQIESKQFLNSEYSRNQWGEGILQQLKQAPAEPWLKLAWRQYLSWFSLTERRLTQEPKLLEKWLRLAEENWLQLQDNDILFDEPRNNGSWIRPWRQALSDFSKSTR